MDINLTDNVTVMTVQVPTGPQVLTVQVPGVQGPPPAIAVNPSTVTGAAGSNASVSVSTVDGVSTLTFTIPRGDTGANGLGVPTGGTAGQVLQKIDATNNNTSWITATDTEVATSIVKRDASGNFAAGTITINDTPVNASDAARKDYVDSGDHLNAINAQTGTAYTFVLADATREVTLSNAAAITATIPTNATVAYPIGTLLKMTQTGAGAVTVSGAGVTINVPPGFTAGTAGQWAQIYARKGATNTWTLTGQLLPATPSVASHLTRKDYVDTQVATKITSFADPNVDAIVFWDDSASAYTGLTPTSPVTITGTALSVAASSETAAGIVELATATETTTGTDNTRAVHPAGLKVELDKKITAFADPNADRIVFWDDSASAFAALSPTTPLTITGTAISIDASTATASGIVELATSAEVATGTDTVRAVTPAGAAATYVKQLFTLNSQTGTTYTFVLTDGTNVMVEGSNAGAITWTVPPNASVAFPVGTVLYGRQTGAGQITIAPGAGVTIRSRGSALKAAGQWSEFMLTQRAANEWVLSGDITT